MRVIEVFPSAGDAESRRCDADSNIIFGDPESPHFDGISCLVITARTRGDIHVISLTLP